MSVVGSAHKHLVYSRRVRVLSESLASLLEPQAIVLDVGTGDGLIAALIAVQRPDIQVRGIDVLVRTRTFIEVTSFDGKTIPFADQSFDVVMLVDVLHHTNDPIVLLREARRVTSGSILIKDHTQDGILARPTLRFMDWIGNADRGVALPYNYWSEAKWRDAIQQLDLVAETWNSDLRLYPFPANLLFDRHLQFIARLKKEQR